MIDTKSNGSKIKDITEPNVIAELILKQLYVQILRLKTNDGQVKLVENLFKKNIIKTLQNKLAKALETQHGI